MGTNPRERLLIIAALVCIAAFAGDRFIVGPLVGAWKARNERIASLEQMVATGEQLLERREAITQRWDEMRARSLPADAADAENRVLNAVGDWAIASRLNVVALKPRQLLDNAQVFSGLEVRVSANGTLESVARFLYELERSPLPLRVENVEIRARDNNGADLSLETLFTGRVLAGEAES